MIKFQHPLDKAGKYLQRILKEFLEKHKENPDPQLQKALKAIEDLLQLDPYDCLLAFSGRIHPFPKGSDPERLEGRTPLDGLHAFVERHDLALMIYPAMTQGL